MSRKVKENQDLCSCYDGKVQVWLEGNKNVIDRKPKKNKDGNLVEKKPNLMSVVKAVLLNQSRLKGVLYEDLAEAIRYIVSDIMGISPQTFYNIYDTNFLKKHKIYSAVTQLIDNAPDEIQAECCFNHKDILFRCLWKDFYDKNLAGSITSHDILYADNSKKDMFKSNIIRAGQVKNIVKKDKASKHGALVDEILFNAIAEEMFINSHLCNTYQDCFYVLGELSKKEEQNGGNDIAISRGYKSILDFFYLNLPCEIQERYGMEYLKARKESGLSPEPIIEISILTRLGRVEDLKQYGFLNVSNTSDYEEDIDDDMSYSMIV